MSDNIAPPCSKCGQQGMAWVTHICPSPTTTPFPPMRKWSGDAWDLPHYPSGYLAGWRDAMTETKGGDWTAAFPIWWPHPPAFSTLDAS